LPTVRGRAILPRVGGTSSCLPGDREVDPGSLWTGVRRPPTLHAGSPPATPAGTIEVPHAEREHPPGYVPPFAGVFIGAVRTELTPTTAPGVEPCPRPLRESRR